MEAAETSVEATKRGSRGLRGGIAADLDSPAPHVGAESEQLLKFHGIYAQDHRDVRRERAQAGLPLEYIFMVRVVVPGGRLSASQWLALDEVADEVADGSLRLTTRQAVQLHAVRKGDLRPLARRIDEVLLSSFGGCGDVVRNVVACPELHLEPEGQLAPSLRASLRSTSPAYYEIFVDGVRAASREWRDERAFYGDAYLPRKFKVAVAHPEENCVDVLAQDVGLVPGTHPARGPGYSVFVGGGLGRSYAQEDTFARLADPLAFVTGDEVEEVLTAVVSVFRDLGDRTNRRRARFKYVVADLGIDAVRARVEGIVGRTLPPALALPAAFEGRDHLGWRAGRPGEWRVGVRVGAGRVRDTDGARLKAALAEIARTTACEFVVTPRQDVIVAGIAGDQRASIQRILDECGVVAPEELGPVARTALACPALPTCGQALAESERRLDELVEGIEATARRVGASRPLELRLTGCPNGCARPALAEIGVVGRTKSTYDVVVGGGPRGDRLARPWREKVPLDQVAGVVEPLLAAWAADGRQGEGFGDFVTRTGAA